MDSLALSDGGKCNWIVGSSGNCDATETASWSLGNLPAGAGKTVYLTPFVSSSAADGLSIALNARAFEAGAQQATATQSISVSASRMLALSVQPLQEPIAPGNTVTYEVAYGHRGGSATTDVVLRFPVPTGSAFVSATDGGILQGNEVIWDLGLVNPGDHGRRRAVVQVSAGAGSILNVNGASISGTTDGLLQTARTVVTTRVEAAPELDIALSTSNDPARSNEFLHTHITVTNRSGATMTNVRVQLFYPSGLFDLDHLAISDGGTCNWIYGGSGDCNSGETLTWNIGNLPAGVGKTVWLTPTAFNENPNGRVIPLFARAFSDTSRDRWERRTVIYQANRALNLVAHADQDPIAPNSTLTYELLFSNTGGNASENTTLRFPIPAGATFVSATEGGTLSGSEVVWDLGLINPQAHGRRRITVQLGAGIVAGTIVRAESPSLTGVAGGVNESARTAVITRVENAPQLDFAIATTSDPTRSDEFLHTFLTVTNRTAGVMNNVRIQIFYPSGLLGLDHLAISDGGTCNWIFGSSGECNSGETLTWLIGTLPPGAGKTVSLTPTALSSNSSGLLIPLVARAFSDSARDRWERRSLVHQGNRQLALAAHADQEPVAPGSVLGYELTYGHIGTVASSNTILRFPIPTGTTFISGTDGGTLIGNEVVWNLGLINPGEHGRRRIMVQIGGTPAGNILQSDSVSLSGTAGGLPQTARTSIATRIENAPQLELAIATSNDPLRSDDFLHTYVTVTNKTAAVMTGTRVAMFYPSGFAALDHLAISDGGTCNWIYGGSSDCDAGETLMWNVGTLAPGAGQTLSLPPVPSSSALTGRPLTLIARAFSDSARDRWERRTMPHQNNRALSLSVDADYEPVIGDLQLPYSLTFANRGPGAAQNSILRLPVPAGMSFISADGGGVLAGNIVQWTIGQIDAGHGGRRQVVFRPISGLVAGTLIQVDDVTLTSSNLGAVRSASTVRLKNNRDLDFSGTMTPSVQLPGNSFTSSLTVVNRSPGTMTTVTPRSFYPGYLQALSHSLISNGGTCNWIYGSSSSCESGEILTWSLGNLEASMTRTVTLSPSLRTPQNMPVGLVIPVYASVRNGGADSAFITRSILVGTLAQAQQVEIEITGNGITILNGHTIPSLQDHTEFDPINIGSNLSRTFTIRNLGGLQLALTGNPPVVLSGAGAAQFQITTPPTTPIAPASISTFTIRYTPTVAGTHTAVVSIANNDADENPTTFTIRGTATQAQPEIELRGNGQVIVNGDSTPAVADGSDFGSTALGGSGLTRSFNVHNVGTASLTLTGNPRVVLSGAGATHFQVTTQAATPIAAGSNVAFSIRYTPTVAGTHSAVVSIANSDADENPTTFTIRGTGTGSLPDLVFRNGFEAQQ
jgi:uncharacterized repeat protein (TIGR01451 family)